MKTFKFFAFILAIFLILPISASALGQMSQPINITNALRGEKIHQEIIAVNTEDKQIAIELTAGGDIKDWVKFYMPKDLNNPIATTTIPGKSNLNMTAVFSIPAETPNGEYKGVVSVTRMPDLYKPKDESSASLAQKIDRQVTIKVSDQEVISLEASVIPKTYDIKMGEPLSVRVIYDNRSNISLKPLINFKIKTNDQSEKVVYNVIYPYPEGEPAVNPQAIQEIPALEVPTMNITSGEYVAYLEFLRGDKVILEKRFGFTIGAQSFVFTTKIIDLIKNNLNGILGLLAVILLVIVGLMMKRNMDLRKSFTKKFSLLKKKIDKKFKTVWTGITGLF